MGRYCLQPHNIDAKVQLQAKGINRRKFIKNSLAGGISVLCLPLTNDVFISSGRKPRYDLSLDSPARFFDGKNCMVHPRVGIVPGAGKNSLPRVVLTMNSLDLSGSDVFRGMYGMQTDDLGKTWTDAIEINDLAPHFEIIDGIKRPVAVSDFWPGWHKKSGVLLGTGHTVAYTPDWKVTSPRPRNTSYSCYDPQTSSWSPWQKLIIPDSEKFYNSGAGCTQRINSSDGTILLPVSFTPPGKNSAVTVLRCSFDGKTLRYIEHGNEVSVDDGTRGLGEPSLTFFKGEYFLTIRNDKLGFVAKSRDGLNFSPLKPWTFDDGSDLGNYNTQQHWVTHSDGLFLVYTRRGANNDHVFRHRAPLFMAQVDPVSPHVIRDSERILVPERGARLGNFGVTDISSHETWVTVSEWMQPRGVEKYGSDGTIFIAKIHWERKNRLFTA